MDDYEKYQDVEENISCPYNQAHSLTRKRLAQHLIKCRKQHPDLAKEFRDCHFNVSHRIPRVEYEYHLSICPDRETFYNASYQIGVNPNNVVPELEKNILVPLDIPCPENWDEVADPRQNILADVQRQAESRCVLQSHSNEPPSVRKAKREEGRRKMREKLNEDDRKKMMARAATSSSSVASESSYRSAASHDDDDSSVVSGSSLRSTLSSDISYQTALENTSHRLDEFQLVERKKKIGRGSAVALTETRPLVGIGRGKLMQSGGVYRG